MSTNGLESWAVDLKDIGAIYPFQGSEVLMVVLGLIFWIGWHILQTRQESAEIEADMAPTEVAMKRERRSTAIIHSLSKTIEGRLVRASLYCTGYSFTSGWQKSSTQS